MKGTMLVHPRLLNASLVYRADVALVAPERDTQFTTSQQASNPFEFSTCGGPTTASTSAPSPTRPVGYTISSS